MKNLHSCIGAAAVLALMPGCQQTPDTATQPVLREGMPTPDYLSPLARNSIRTRMALHGEEMNRLVQAALVLDYRKASEIAERIESGSMLDRPDASSGNRSTGDAPSDFSRLMQNTGSSLQFLELKNELPSRFFDLQVQLQEDAKAVKQAAERRSGPSLGREIGRLSETCISCHAEYMAGPPRP